MPKKIPDDQSTSPVRSTRYRTGVVVGVLVTVLAIGIVASCSSKQNPPVTERSNITTSGGNGAAFCAFLSRLGDRAQAIVDDSERLTALESFDSEFDQALLDAPAEIRPDVVTMVEASRNAIAAKDPAVAVSDRVSEAGHRLDQYCNTSPEPK